jgi:hypothetical protein
VVNVLLLAGRAPPTRRCSAAQASICLRPRWWRASRSVSADPGSADLANPLLLTAGRLRRFRSSTAMAVRSRTALPHRLPRPVAATGLAALAWHAQFERFGASGVRRFADRPRPMTAHDWAAAPAAPWSPPQSAPRAGGGLGQALAANELELEGVNLSFRPGTAAPAVLLTDGQA